MSPPAPPHGRSAASLAIVAGVLFTLWIAAALPGEVFYSGDGGVKLLMTRQFAAGDLGASLELPGEPWVQELWARGLYPLAPPFVREYGGDRFLQYPLVFPALSAPFYAALGWAGLYVLPLTSLWLLWWALDRCWARLGLGPGTRLAGAIAAVFACPLTLYGPIFWEHTLSCALLFAGVAVVAEAVRGDGARRRAIVGGLLAGASVLLRPELLLPVVLLAAWPWVERQPERRPSARLAFAAALAAGPLLQLAINLVQSGRLHGLQGVESLEEAGFASHVRQYPWMLRTLVGGLLATYPLALFPAFVRLLSFRNTDARRRRLRGLPWIALAVVLVVPFVTATTGEKQWGPRYLFGALPILALLVGTSFQEMTLLRSRTARWAGLLVFGALLALGVRSTAFEGAAMLRTNYQARLWPALEVVREDDARVVAVSHQFIAHELASLTETKRIFRTETQADLERLAAALAARGERRFVFVRRGRDSGPRNSSLPDGRELRFSPLPSPTTHRIFEGEIR